MHCDPCWGGSSLILTLTPRCVPETLPCRSSCSCSYAREVAVYMERLRLPRGFCTYPEFAVCMCGSILLKVDSRSGPSVPDIRHVGPYPFPCSTPCSTVCTP
mgnify:CR=1 FL=1